MDTVDADVPIAMKKVYRRLERWRSKRVGRARIPEALWAAAGELARQHGVNRVSKVLRLEFNRLKRMAESSEPMASKRRVAPPAFVELIAPQAAAPECMIELEGQRGRLRIEFKGTSTADLARFSQTLWEMVS